MSRAFNWCRQIIYILLLVQNVAQPRNQLAEATSQISSVWIEKDGGEHSKWAPEINKSTRDTAASNTSSSEPERSRAQADEKLFAAAASSLHAQVADTPRNWPPAQQVGPQRRSSQPVPLASPQFKLAHIGDDSYQVADRLQEADKERQSAKSGRSNQATNLGVHFDEDPNEQNARNRNSVPKPVVGDFEAIDRRQDNETSFDLKHADFPSADGGISYDELQQQTNRSQFELPDVRNQTERRRDAWRGSDPVAGIYYSPDADTWNLSPPDEIDRGQQRRRRPASRRGVVRVPPGRGQPDDEMYFTNYTTTTSLPPVDTAAPDRQHEQPPQVERIAQTQPPRPPDFNRWPAPVASLLPDSRDLTSFKYDSEPHQQRVSFQPIPTNIKQPQQFWRAAASGAPAFQQVAPAVNHAPPIYNTLRVVPQAAQLPHTLHQLLSAGQSNGLVATQPIRRSKPAHQQIVQLGETASQVSGGKSFLRSYNPMQLLGGGKTRKSILGNINEKLNHWMGDSAHSNNRDELRFLESAFFDPQQHRHQLERPKLSAGAANFRSVRPLHSMERPPYLGPIRQPTVAPVSAARFHGHASLQQQLAGLSGPPHRPPAARQNRVVVQQQSSQQPASFIPVVAVQVTRTSPAPTPAQELANSPSFGGLAEASGQSSASTNEIDRYLAAKLSGPMRNQFDANERQKWDDSSSSAGVSYPDPYQGTRQAARHQRPALNHETTVKGAVFGYLPHQAGAPLMQAMNVLQQLPSHSQMAPADSSRPDHSLDFYSNLHAGNELYANQMDKSSQSVEAATSLLDFQQPSRSQLGDEQANLALQLQASNFVQNDIAHPFGLAAMNLGESPHYEKQPVRRRAPMSVQQQQYQFGPPFQLVSSSQLQAAAAAASSHQDQLSQLVANQLSPMQSNPVEPFYAILQTASGGPNLQQSPANELSSIIFQAAHQPQESFYHLPAREQQRRPQLEDTPNSALDSAEAGQSDVTSQPNEPINQETQRNEALSTKGRKRSSEFFASAGQLLLSALPLLLAPTLGLMFAAAPSIPAARYHGQLAPASGHSNLFGGGPGEPPRDPSGQLDDGLVLNASPVPQIFTPSPPGVHHLHEEQLDASSSQSRPINERPRERKPPASTTTSTTAQPRGQFKSSASLPALTGIKLSANSSRKLDSGQASTRRPFSAVMLTTLGPGVKLIANGSELDLSAGSGANDSLELADSGSGDTTLITPTLLLIETQPEDQQAPGSGEPNRQEDSSEDRAQKPATKRADNATRSGPPRDSLQYDVGYQGADFDAQFPTLRKPAAMNSKWVRPESSPATLDKLVRNKSQYQYDHLQGPPGTSSQSPTSGRGEQHHQADSDPEKLYPVSTWPAMRRRTVSLITSSGNKTVLEAVPRRAAPAAAPSVKPNARLESNSSRAEEPSNRRELDKLESFLAEADENRASRSKEKRKIAPSPIRRKREALETARLDLSKRQPASNSTGGPVKRANKRRRLKRRREAASSNHRLKQNASSSDQMDQLDGDASRRKSAIVTAMITQVGGERATDQEPETDDRGRPPDGAADEELDVESQLAQELHAQLAKKLALDHVATRMAAAATTGANESDQADDELDGLRSSGRGRFRPVPVADFPLNETEAGLTWPRQNFSSTRFVGGHSPRDRAMKSNSIELNEETERALAKFSSLWLEDTLQANPAGFDAADRRRRHRRGDVTKRSKYQPDRGLPGELQESSATERSYSSSRATTQMPLISADQLQENWSHYYNSERNLSGRPHELQQPPLVYNHPQSRARGRHHHRHRHHHEEANERFESARSHRGAQQENGNLTSSAGESGDGSQAVAFKQTRPTGGGLSHELGGAHRNESAFEGSDRDLLDARHSNYLNYSTSAPGHYPPHPHEYYQPLGPARPPDSGLPSSPPPPSYYPDEHYARQPPPSQQQQHYPMSSYGPNEPPSPYGQDSRRVRPPARPWDYPPDSRRPAQQPADEYAGHSRNYMPSPPARIPYEQHPASSNPLDEYSNSNNQHHHPQHPPVSSTYAPASSSLTPHQTFASPFQPPAPFAGHRPSAASSRGPTPEVVNSRSIGDYLKRAQFSDSDRDKLMASYLTCDGLLHDNDHCLERLSCEFSDPKNIETANKLDRAVSSILLGHILINGFIPSNFKLRLKSASMYGYTHSGKCSRFACSKLAKQSSGSSQETQNLHDEETQHNNINNDRRR